MATQPEPGAIEQRRQRLMAGGRLALLGALIWIFAALDLPTPLAVIPIVLAVLALMLLATALRMRARTLGGRADGERPQITPDLVALTLVAAAGLVVLVIQIAS
jgi:hypothetical protein